MIVAIRGEVCGSRSALTVWNFAEETSVVLLTEGQQPLIPGKPALRERRAQGC